MLAFLGVLLVIPLEMFLDVLLPEPPSIFCGEAL